MLFLIGGQSFGDTCTGHLDTRALVSWTHVHWSVGHTCTVHLDTRALVIWKVFRARLCVWLCVSEKFCGISGISLKWKAVLSPELNRIFEDCDLNMIFCVNGLVCCMCAHVCMRVCVCTRLCLYTSTYICIGFFVYMPPPLTHTQAHTHTGTQTQFSQCPCL